MKNLLPLALVLLAVPSFAAKAPNFKIASVQNAPVTKIGGVADLKGKVVFLEFWATWCGPCVAGIPHVNRVIDSVKGEPVVFLSVSDEPPAMIETFRKTHEMKAWVGADEAQSSFKAYHVTSRPAGYLIGKDGTLLASIFPDDLKEQDLRDALAGTYTPKPVAWAEAARAKAPAAAPAGKVYFEASVSAASGEPGMKDNDDGLEATAMPFARSVAWIWDVQFDQVIVDSPPVSAFNFALKTGPENFERGREILREAVEVGFGVRATREKRETDALVLTFFSAPGAPHPKLGAEGGHSGLMAYGGGRLLGKVGMPEVARALWMSLDKPVVDETGLKGEYDFDLEWKSGDRAALEALLAAQGLTLVPARRTVEFLRVSPARP